MSLNLYGDESRVVDYLHSLGLDESEAKIYTAVLCRQYRAPLNELISVLKYHVPGSKKAPASADQKIAAAIEKLIRSNLFRVVHGRREDIIEAHSPWEQAILMAFPGAQNIDPVIASIINESLRHFGEFSPRERMLIERIGWASWEQPRQSFRNAISEARQRIRIGVYSSITVFDEVRDQVRQALVDRSRMEIQILMFSPKLAAKIENNPDLAHDVETRTKDWQLLFDQAKTEANRLGRKPRMEIRHINDETYSGIHRIGLIDSHKWIFNIHRPGVERGVEGMVYQGVCDDKTPSNMYIILDRYWQDAWEAAVPVARLPRFIRWARDNRHVLILPVFAVLGWEIFTTAGNWLGIKNEWWGGALIGLAISEIYNNSTNILNSLLEFSRRILDALQKSFTPHKD